MFDTVKYISAEIAKKWGEELDVYSMVTRDGRRMVSRDAGRTFELVPTNALSAHVPAVRPWKIYVVKATHTDIGLHNSQYIQRHGTIKRIEDAMRLVDSDPRGDDDPAAYRYVMEGTWFWENYPMDRGPARPWARPTTGWRAPAEVTTRGSPRGKI